MNFSDRNGCRLGLLVVLLLLGGGCARQATDQPKESLFIQSLKHDLTGLPEDIVEDSNKVFLSNRANMFALMLAGGASVVMHNSNADDDIQDDVQHHRVFKGFCDESLNIVGSPASHFAAAGLWYALSAEDNDQFNKERAWTLVRALSVNGVVTLGLKAIRDNDTPNHKRWAWPSGHTSSSFTVASVLDEFYGPKVGIPAYALASVVAYRMVDTGDHWTSDVIFGATLGWVVGHTIAGEHKSLEIAGCQVIPYAGGEQAVAGLAITRRF